MLDNFITSTLFLLLLGFLFIVNTILGIYLGSKETRFDFKKLLSGILKGIIIAFCIISFCFVIEVVPTILKRIGIELPSDLITLTEMMGITLTAYKKYVLDCFDKIKKIFNENK